jgi:hypothetical protein
MLTAEARVDTDRAGRYLAQLCRHAGEMGRYSGHRPRMHGSGHRPPDLRNVEWTDTEGTIATGEARCTLRATENTLTLRAEAGDRQQLERLQDLVRTRLETIGRRDDLKVIWQVPQGTPDIAEAPRPRKGNPIAIAAAVALAIAVHIGLGTTLVADVRWTWAADAVVAVAVVKVIVVTVIARRRRKRA